MYPPPKLNMSPEKGVSKNSLPTIIFEGSILRDVSSAAEELSETSVAEESKNTQRVFKFNAPRDRLTAVGRGFPAIFNRGGGYFFSESHHPIDLRNFSRLPGASIIFRWYQNVYINMWIFRGAVSMGHRVAWKPQDVVAASSVGSWGREGSDGWLMVSLFFW